MRPIDKYVEAMENKDFAGLANLFTEDGVLCDYCSNSSSQREYHIYGQAAINMFFRNKFGFRQYSILGAEVVNEKQAEFIANFGEGKLCQLVNQIHGNVAGKGYVLVAFLSLDI